MPLRSWCGGFGGIGVHPAWFHEAASNTRQLARVQDVKRSCLLVTQDWSGIDEAGAGAGGAGGVGGAGGEARRWNSTPRGIEGAMGQGWEGITSEAAIRIHSSLSSPPSSPSIQIAHASGQLLLTPPAANASIAGSSGTAGSTHDSTHAPQIRLTSFSRPPSSSSSSSSSAVPPPSSSSSGPPGGEGGSRQLNRRILECRTLDELALLISASLRFFNYIHIATALRSIAKLRLAWRKSR
eukprot:CAMPEP_0177714072 /NCGR_PEP_ID=MMETSP0484_2-20121128/13271_1 /TAXON_ID=354590 /ORGANISM="Rhodomonas lens, Strain RHODO" /LENGTH=238 /DNA_ID=CAMNT_0019225991 /DNA_START=299 /DNA_END=1012 /DNA_ORIENTATION=+